MIHQEIYKENNNCNIYDNREKMELYEYIDLSNYTSYFNKIEKTAEKNKQFSFKVLLDDFDKNIIYNNDILRFKKDINKNLDQMEKYFEKGYLLRLEQLNEECLNKFYNLIENEINKLIREKNCKYYLFIKQGLYEKLILISNSYKKSKENNVNKKQMVILNIFVKNMMKEYIVKINILKKYNCLNKELTHYDDLLYINMNSTNEVDNVLSQINEYNKVYDKILLPSKIIIKEINQGITYIDIKNIIYPKISCSGEIQIIMKNNENEIGNVFVKFEDILISYINLYCLKIKNYIFSIKVVISYNKVLFNSIKNFGNSLDLFIVFVKKGIG